MYKKPLITFIAANGLVLMVSIMAFLPQTINADLTNSNVKLSQSTLVSNGHLTICKINKSSYEVVKTITMVLTAYSSTPDQTDDTPFITASGKKVADGIIANNMLSFGTKIRIPALYGDKIFTVEDRMNKRKGNHQADIWFPSREQATEFGAKTTTIEILES